MSGSFEINIQFKRALDLLADHTKSVFITGKAGTGKSTLLEYFSKKAENKPVLLAPTGVAALNIKGQTIHSFFNFYIDVTPEKIRNREMKPRNAQLYKSLRSIIIDEVSMVRADTLDCIDAFLRIYGPFNTKPFGGVQMVFVGDLYQLPPVVNAEEQAIFSGVYESPYFFSARAFEALNIEIIELEKVYRQKDQNFVDLLNRIRNNALDNADLEQLNSRFLPEYKHKTGEFFINLTATNKKADQINDDHLSKLLGKSYSYEARISGKFNKEYFPTATTLSFKVGSQVMMLNNDAKKRYVNGSIGIIQSVKVIDGEDTVFIKLQDDGYIVGVQVFEWEVFRFFLENDGIKSEAVGTFSQFPFRLAWAVTIHKSQGKTFERVVIDIGTGAFAVGQVYVGLSRCTSFEGVVLKAPIKRHHIRSDSRIHKFLTEYQCARAHEEHVNNIKDAINKNLMLSISYLKAEDNKSELVIKPLSLGTQTFEGQKYKAFRALCLATKEQKIFHVARVLKLAVLEDEKNNI